MKKAVIFKYNRFFDKEEREKITSGLKELFSGTDSKPIIIFDVDDSLKIYTDREYIFDNITYEDLSYFIRDQKLKRILK